MRGDCAGGEELAFAPLDEHALARVGVVRGPDLVRVAQEAVVHAPAARGAGLDVHLRILGAELREQVVEAHGVVERQVRLVRRVEIGGTHVEEVRVRVPLDVGKIGDLRVERVELAEDVVAHGRVGVVEHGLRTAAPHVHGTPLLADHPVGMRLENPAVGVHHLGFHPEAELEPALLRLVAEAHEAVRQFLGIHHPVAEAHLVLVDGVARVLACAEPAVIQDEQLAAHFLHAVHHVVQHLLGEAEVAAFPAVEQHGAQLVSGGHLPVARPAVDVAGNLALARIGVGERELRKRDRLARVEHVRAGGSVRPRADLDEVARIALHADVPRSGPAEDAADHAPGCLGGH